MTYIAPYTPSHTPQDDEKQSIIKWVFQELLRISGVLSLLSTPKVAKVYRSGSPTTQTLSGTWAAFDVFDAQTAEDNIFVAADHSYFTVETSGAYLITVTTDVSVNANSILVSFGVSIGGNDPGDDTVITPLFVTADENKLVSFSFPLVLNAGDDVQIMIKDPESGTDTLSIREAICGIIGV